MPSVPLLSELSERGSPVDQGVIAMNLLAKLMVTRAPAATLLIRLLAGAVFFIEGAKKFLFAAQWGAGRFARIGIPFPEFTGPFVGVVEIVCGALLLLGLLTRPAALVLLINISVAIATTKVPILLKSGFFAMEDAARTDYSMFMSLLFLLSVGAGCWSLDALLGRHGMAERSRPAEGHG
jgi:putative oxidoreductase